MDTNSMLCSISPGSGPIWMRNPSCYGEMACFTDCYLRFYKSYYSDHQYDLAVNCSMFSSKFLQSAILNAIINFLSIHVTS